VKRTGRDRVVRNTLIAAGNSGDASLIPLVMSLLSDASPLVRAMAIWALRRLGPPDAVSAAKDRFYPRETDETVRNEWHIEIPQ
jgi:epoxyqueuosine reductase